MIPAPEQKQLNVEIPGDLLREVKIRAAIDGVAVRALVEDAIRAHLRRPRKKEKENA